MPIPAFALRPIKDQVDHRLIDGAEIVFGDLPLDHQDAGDAGFRRAVLSMGRQAAHLFEHCLSGEILNQ
ncbi:hypothetical protein ACC684_39530, partial [Rhizobium ruizarguesonis]